MEDARIEAQKDAQGWASVMAGNVYRVTMAAENGLYGLEHALAWLVRDLCNTARGWMKWALR